MLLPRRRLVSNPGNIKLQMYATPLHLSSRDGYEEISILLIDKGANVRSEDLDGWEPIHYAAKSGKKSLVALLLERGVGVDSPNVDNETALHLAAENGYSVVVSLLLSAGASVEARTQVFLPICNYKVFNALHLAVIGGHKEVVSLLLDAGADIEAKINEGRTALQLAANEMQEEVATGEQLEIINLLLERGADFEARDRLSYGQNLVAFAAGDGAYTDLMYSLLAKGADVNHALRCATRKRNLRAIATLLEVGADAEAADEVGT
jgi:ankyrin repeat protein